MTHPVGALHASCVMRPGCVASGDAKTEDAIHDASSGSVARVMFVSPLVTHICEDATRDASSSRPTRHVAYSTQRATHPYRTHRRTRIARESA